VIAARNVERVRGEASRVARSFGVRTEGVACDVATREGTDDLIADVRRLFGGADILINNAGAGSNETVMEAPDEKWDAYWDLHVMAAVRLARGLAPVMKARGGGVILHNASICATQPLWYEPIYNTTKAALMMFSKCLATELVRDNIRVNCVNPGLILTPDWIRTAKQLTAEKGGDWQAYLDGVARELAPINRFASPQELANFFVFLCSDRASYSVGSTYFVDGGMLKTV
jgi:3-oxoacyl-[acyl-carrier protein] reductase